MTPGIRNLGRILLRVVAGCAVLLVIAALGGLVVVQSGWFHEYVRERIIAEIQRATGARVELGRFSFRGATLTATIAPLVLHGREGEDEPPLLRVESASLGLRIISFAEHKMDLAFVQVEKPRLHIVIYPDGSTNFPGGGHTGVEGWPQELINLAIQHYEVSDGVVELDERSIPVNLRGDGLGLKLTYDAKAPSYKAELSSRGLRVAPAGLAPIEFGFSSQLALEKSRLAISALHLSTPASRAELKGILDNPLAPHGTLSVEATLSVREAAAMFPLPITPSGSADFSGSLNIDFAQLSGFEARGAAVARGIGYLSGRLHIAGAQARAQIEMNASGIQARNVHASALGGEFDGSASLAQWKHAHVEGAVDGLTVAQVAGVVTSRPLPWDGQLSGGVMADLTLGQNDAQARANLAISPAAQGVPIEGLINGTYNQHEEELTLENSFVATPATRLEASGALGRRMNVQFRSTQINDVLAVLPLIEDDHTVQLPMGLKYGSIVANGVVTGSLDDPRFRGQVNVTAGSVGGHGFDAFDGQVDLAESELSASRFNLTRGGMQIAGTATLTANHGAFTDAATSAQFNVRNANIEDLVKEAGGSAAISGTAAASVRIAGKLSEPQADVTLNIANPRGFGEAMDRLTATLRVTKASLDVSNGEAQDGAGRVTFSGAYKPAARDWKTGDASLQASTRGYPLARLEAVKALQAGFDARVTADIRVQARVNGDALALTSASGTLAAQNVTFHGQALGDVALGAETRGQDVSVNAQGTIEGSQLSGNGTWRLDGDQGGFASFRFSRMTLEQTHQFAILLGAAPQEPEAPLPLEGFLGGGSATLRLALSHPRDFQATVTLDALQFNPRAGQTLGIGVKPEDVVLRSAQPVVVEVDAKELQIQPARLTGTDTNLEVGGTVPFSGTTGADISVRGGVNLVALQLINPNLLARGDATVEASLRGSLADPALSGRMDLKGASLYLKDVTTGLDNVNGGVLFNRSRATIDKLTAQLGSGTLSMGGFVEFGTPLVYRLQAQVQQVRVRLPIDLSTTFTANLALGGTSDASTLSGTLTLNRAAFNPRTDLGQLFAAFAQPTPEASENDYLKGMQFDVRVESAPNFELQTSLTRDVQAEVDLRLRGTPVRPLVLGSVSVNAGQVQFLGNQYTIDRGDIRFINPLKIVPVFDVALETRVSGVLVNIAFSGPIDKLVPNYSSDPPLESSKIVALLAVGRDPSQYAGAAAAQATVNSANFVGAGGSLLSQAISAQLSSKLQRFLGASRVKIDPTMTGVDNTPQARLTFEQQVSKDVTMTYITNLNYTQEQIVRLQWDFTPKWSAIAVRDANGLFGIDFQYRKSFK